MNARAEDLKWNGSEGHMTWNTDSENLNWLSGGNQVAYTNDSYVKFEDNGSGVVTLVGELVSQGVTVDNSAGCDYTFTGEGTIVGDFCRLTKWGAGTLTINTANSFYETKLERGKLVLGNAGALGSKEVHLYGGTLDLNNQTIGNQVYVDNDASIGNGTLEYVMTISSDTTLTLCGELKGEAMISMLPNATLNLAGNTVSDKLIYLNSTASIGNGTINGRVDADTARTLTFFGKTYIRDTGSISGNGIISLADNATLVTC